MLIDYNLIKAKGIVTSLFCLQKPDSAAFWVRLQSARIVAERANTVGLLLVRHKRIKPRSTLLPKKLVPLPVELSICLRGVYVVP